MAVLKLFRYWTLWISKQHTGTLHHVITVYNDISDHMHGMMRALAINKTQWMEDLYFAVKVARQNMSKYHAKLTAPTGLHLISAHILHRFRKVRSFRMWEEAMDMNPEDQMSYCTQYLEAFLKCVQNEYCGKHRRLSVTKPENDQHSNFVPSSNAAGFGQSSFDPYDSSSDDDEY